MSGSCSRRAADAAGLLAHPLRVLVLAEWPPDRRLGVVELAQTADCSLSDAAYHLRVLADTGALRLRDDHEPPAFAVTELGRALADVVPALADVVAHALVNVDEPDAPAVLELEQLEVPVAERPPKVVVDLPDAEDVAPAESEGEDVDEPASPVEAEPFGLARHRRPGRREQLLELLSEQPGLTLREAAGQLGLTDTRVLAGPVRRLIAEGLLTRDGKRLSLVDVEPPETRWSP